MTPTFALLSEHTRAEIGGDNPPFHSRGGAYTYVAATVSDPSSHQLEAAQFVTYYGDVPPFVVAAVRADEPPPFHVFVEVGTDRFLYLGHGRMAALRMGHEKATMIGFHMEAAVPDVDIANIAPDLLDQVPPMPASVHFYVELVRADESWTAAVPGFGIEALESSFLAALAEAEKRATREVMGMLVNGESLPHHTVDTHGLRTLEAGAAWPTETFARSPRVVVCVNVFSADLRIPGCVVARDQCWF